MTDYFCRMTAPFATQTEAITMIAEKCVKVLVYEHNEETSRIHIHMYLVGCQVSTDTLKNYFKRSGFKGGNKDWSFKLSRDDGCITYMTKGIYDPSFVKGYSDEELAEYKARWEHRNPVIKGKVQSKLTFVVKETQAQSKKRKNDLLEEMIKLLPEHTSDDIIVNTIIKVLNANQTIFSRYSVRDYYDTIKGRVDTQRFVDTMILFCAYNR